MENKRPMLLKKFNSQFQGFLFLTLVLLYLIHVQSENFEEQPDSSSKLAVHKQRKKNAGNILGMGSLKYTFDNKLLTNESDAMQRGGICIQNFAAHQKIQIINFQTFFFIFNFFALTLDKTILKQRREFGIFILFLNKKERKGLLACSF